MVKNADPVLEGAAGNRDVAFDLGEAERCVEGSARTVSTTGEVVEMAELRDKLGRQLCSTLLVGIVPYRTGIGCRSK